MNDEARMTNGLAGDKAPSVQPPSAREIPSSKHQRSSCHVRWQSGGMQSLGNQGPSGFVRLCQTLEFLKVLADGHQPHRTSTTDQHGSGARFKAQGAQPSIPMISHQIPRFLNQKIVRAARATTEAQRHRGLCSRPTRVPGVGLGGIKVNQTTFYLCEPHWQTPIDTDGEGRRAPPPHQRKNSKKTRWSFRLNPGKSEHFFIKHETH